MLLSIAVSSSYNYQLKYLKLCRFSASQMTGLCKLKKCISVNCISTWTCLLNFSFCQTFITPNLILARLVMRGKRGNLGKDVKFDSSGFDLEEAAALSLKLKKQVRKLSS